MPVVGNITGNPASAPAETIVNTFWPDIEPDHAREIIRIHSDVPAARLHYYLNNARYRVNAELAAYQTAQQANGISHSDNLAEADAAQHHYRCAVYKYAEAELIESYRDYDSTASGHDRAEQQAASVDTLRADAHRALVAIKGQPFATIELL